MGEWQHGLLGCFGNLGVCIVTYFLPCYTYGRNAEALGESCCCNALLFLVPILNIILHIQHRGRIREAKDIDGGCCGDALVSLFCMCCALVQEAQEVSDMHAGMALDIERM